MTDSTYNGWTNYPTWRINLEYFDGFEPKGFEDFSFETLMEYIKEGVEEDIAMESKGHAKMYAFAFLADVNWYEIATHLYNQIHEKEEN